MKSTNIWNDLSIRYDESWVLRDLEEGGILLFPEDFVGYPLLELPVSLIVRVLATDRDLARAAMLLMEKRGWTGPDHLERESLVLRFDWTDGILDLESYFVGIGEGQMIEVMLGVDPNAPGQGAFSGGQSLFEAFSHYVDLQGLLDIAAARAG